MKYIYFSRTALCACGLLVLISSFWVGPALGADRLIGIQSARAYELSTNGKSRTAVPVRALLFRVLVTRSDWSG